eukprot:Gb_33311 [translate_table: standard]
MAMAQPLWNQNKVILGLEPMRQLHETKGTFITITKTGAQHGNAKANDASSGTDISVDVRTLCKQGRLKEAMTIFHQMDGRGIRPDSSTYASLLQGCVNQKALSEGKLVHAHMNKKGFEPGIYLGTKLVILYAKCGRLVDARRVLDELPERNVVSWTAMIAAYSKYGNDEEALRLFCLMHRTGIRPDQFTLASVVSTCANLAALDHGKEIHGNIIRSAFQPDVFVGSGLVDMYVKCRSIKDARQVFDKMPERDVVTWNAMIAGYAQNGNVDEALELFQKMPERNVVTWNVMITGYAQNGRVDEALEFFQKMPERYEVSWNAMIAGYAQNGHIDEALDLFQKMPEPSVVSWTALIAGYTQNGYFAHALKYFKQMQLAGVKPNSVTFASILPACANLVALEHGKEIHENAVRSGFESDIVVGNALVDTYCKCGSIKDARQVFDKMPKQNVISWTAMIIGYAMHGCGKEALKLFEQMQQSGTKPNHVTLVGVLSACCHAGLVDDGWRYFTRMSQDYHVTPATEHYCCMVDLLGRAGCLDEAHNFILKMPIKPDAAVWGSLLGACRIHANIRLGEHVAERLFESDPKNAAHYVLLSNIYAAVGRWDDAEKVRKMMNERRVEKMPGCSWIEVSGKVYTFLVGDKSHP